MNTKQLRCLRVLLMLATLSFGLVSAKDAHAINQMRMCARFITSYRDVRQGQDFLYNAPEPATRHWGVVEGFTGNYIFNDYLVDTMVGGARYACTPWLQIGPAGFHTLWVTNAVQVDAGKYINVFPDTNNAFLWHAQTFTTPANPIGDSEFNATFTASVTDHVSLVAARISPSSMVIPAGSTIVTYRTYADFNGLSQTGNDVFIGRIAVNGVVEKDAYWRSVVGHEMGHQMAGHMFGTWSHPYGQNTVLAPNFACNCDKVEVVADQSHCMNSREGVGAARSEAWAHSFSNQLLNLQSDTIAPFGYYKRLYDPNAPGDHILYPPFTVDSTVNFNWMEGYCNLANAGTEVDWFSFFYQLDAKTANAWTIGNFWNVFQTECGVPPIDSCVVSWQSLQTATNSFFGLGSAKAIYMATTGDLNGVNH